MARIALKVINKILTNYVNDFYKIETTSCFSLIERKKWMYRRKCRLRNVKMAIFRLKNWNFVALGSQKNMLSSLILKNE